MSQEFRNILKPYQEMSVRYDRNQEALWCYFKPSDRPCFSFQTLRESREIQQAVVRYFEAGEDQVNFPIRYLVLASQTPGVFNLGGDLDLFIKLIERKDRDALLEYATYCVEICYLNAVNLHLPLTTISLVQGSALGGGFESAMSSNVLIAERHAQLGLPEIRFNLFPGMGAYSFLARRLGMVKAEEMIASGKIYSGSEMQSLGVIDILAESGKGHEAVDCFIRKHRRLSNGLQAVKKLRKFYNPVTYQELMDITTLWVNTALELEEKDLKTMARLVLAQSRGQLASEHKPGKLHIVRTLQDRRIDSETVTFPLIDDSGNRVIQDRRQNYDRRSLDILRVSN